MQKSNSKLIEQLLREYFKGEPFFIALIRAKELELFIKQFAAAKGAQVLDIGCGDGFFARQILRYSQREGLKIHGLDPDKSALKLAEREGVYTDLSHYHGKVFPYNSDRFDYLFSNCVLEHVSNIDQNLSESARVLKKGGKYYLTVATDNWEKYLLGTLFLGGYYKKLMRKVQRHEHLFSMQEWEVRFKRAGFKVVRKIGYMDSQTVKLIDLFHYLSLPNLVTKLIFKRWVLFPQIYDFLKIEKVFAKYTGREVFPDKSGAIYYELEKK